MSEKRRRPGQAGLLERQWVAHIGRGENIGTPAGFDSSAEHTRGTEFGLDFDIVFASKLIGDFA
jgi:hypothetical protein